jgi:hypothetical protein
MIDVVPARLERVSGLTKSVRSDQAVAICRAGLIVAVALRESAADGQWLTAARDLSTIPYGIRMARVT